MLDGFDGKLIELPSSYRLDREVLVGHLDMYTLFVSDDRRWAGRDGP